MALGPSASDTDFRPLFERARKDGGVEFLLTLVRVDGIQCYDGYEDEFLVLRRDLNHPTLEPNLDNYRRLASFPGPRTLLLNLVNCVQSKHHDISPFRTLLTGSFPNQIQPTGSEILAFVLPPVFAALSSISWLRVSRGVIGRSSLRPSPGHRPSLSRPSTSSRVF